jgi:hypothetical protein
MEGNLIEGYDYESDAPGTALALAPNAARKAEELLATATETQHRFDRVARLVEGYETPYGLELLASVHWVATKEGARDRPHIAEATRQWGHRKRQFTEEQIGLAIDRLQSEDWLSLTPAG